MAIIKLPLNTKPGCSPRSSMSTLNLFTISINTITDLKNNTTLHRLLLFSAIDELTGSAPCSRSQGYCCLCQTLLTISRTPGTARPFAPRIYDAEFLTSHHRTSTAAFPNTPAASMLPRTPWPPRLPALLPRAAPCRTALTRAQATTEGSRGHQLGQSTSQPP